MSRYRRIKTDGGAYFFTVTLADRSSDLLLRQIDRLRRIYMSVQTRYTFETVAICILPDHLHAIWSLPRGDCDYPLRWSLIKAGFSRGLQEAAPRTKSKIARRERGLWQRRYWEHAIRDDADLERHVDYRAPRTIRRIGVLSVVPERSGAGSCSGGAGSGPFSRRRNIAGAFYATRHRLHPHAGLRRAPPPPARAEPAGLCCRPGS
jgi:putative transposase